VVAVFLYALRREVLRNLLVGQRVEVLAFEFLYALRREVLRNMAARISLFEVDLAGFYTPFGVRCFGTVLGERVASRLPEMFLYALRREVLRNSPTSTPCGVSSRSRSFYTPFGVRCFGTLPRSVAR